MEEQIEQNKPFKIKLNYTVLIFIIALLLGITLPFHYVPYEFIVFPKENLTMKNTFIFESEIDTFISRYNKANANQQRLMRLDPIVQKLFEKKLIVDSTNFEK
ncbi:hypothetical protein [Mucilaginibacter paludis]|uniref:Uncharacterized protein n=1 Tax=Mucilaginibacter paludis DSM 18603 TaxID=714943 RepID=H1Y6K4_9SPHI|nr:hypothetical protein [Mucilaginibacter paludis]EHQ25848.1 hypothetical protein Mucpa_1693 [Mucilaginibacter paludis DSM 18603]